jgi:hypothetical protein
LKVTAGNLGLEICEFVLLLSMSPDLSKYKVPLVINFLSHLSTLEALPTPMQVHRDAQLVPDLSAANDSICKLPPECDAVTVHLSANSEIISWSKYKSKYQ